VLAAKLQPPIGYRLCALIARATNAATEAATKSPALTGLSPPSGNSCSPRAVMFTVGGN
jgi:hypothetical protein